VRLTGGDLVIRCVLLRIQWCPSIAFVVRKICRLLAGELDPSCTTFGAKDEIAMRARVPYAMNMAHCACFRRLIVKMDEDLGCVKGRRNWTEKFSLLTAE
jgi:hypothetical protein